MNPPTPDSEPETSPGNSSQQWIAHSMLSGAWRFMLVSIGGFAVWAFGGRWFYKNVGEAGLYAASAAVFISLAGLLMHPLVHGPRRLSRFYGVFVPAFLAYAIVWSIFWFWLRFGPGEWLGSLAGSVVFVAVAGWRLSSLRSVWIAIAVFFAAHSLGYFAGGKLMYFLTSPEGAKMFQFLSKSQLGTLAKLGWGVFYGLGFGAGLGFTFRAFQEPGASGRPTQRDAPQPSLPIF